MLYAVLRVSLNVLAFSTAIAFILCNVFVLRQLWCISHEGASTECVTPLPAWIYDPLEWFWLHFADIVSLSMVLVAGLGLGGLIWIVLYEDFKKYYARAREKHKPK